jgi:hypothetical protein
MSARPPTPAMFVSCHMVDHSARHPRIDDDPSPRRSRGIAIVIRPCSRRDGRIEIRIERTKRLAKAVEAWTTLPAGVWISFDFDLTVASASSSARPLLDAQVATTGTARRNRGVLADKALGFRAFEREAVASSCLMSTRSQHTPAEAVARPDRVLARHGLLTPRVPAPPTGRPTCGSPLDVATVSVDPPLCERRRPTHG